MNAPLNVTSLSIDTLGTLLAEIADLTRQADAIKDALKDTATATIDAPKVFDGCLFKATVIEQNRTVVDYKSLVRDLGITQAEIDLYTKTTAVISIKTTTR
jgi:hypothetical protein